MRKVFLTILLLTATYLTYALNPVGRNFSKDVYKGGTQTWDIVQGSGGVMYFANNSGVLEFDGREWKSYRLNNYTSVRSLFYDRSEPALYAGGTNELGRFRCMPDGVVYESLLDSLNISVTEIWNIEKTARATLCSRTKARGMS